VWEEESTGRGETGVEGSVGGGLWSLVALVSGAAGALKGRKGSIGWEGPHPSEETMAHDPLASTPGLTQVEKEKLYEALEYDPRYTFPPIILCLLDVYL
jgi:hypothetical protein